MGVDVVSGEVAVAEEAGVEGALGEGEAEVGPEVGLGGEGEVEAVVDVEEGAHFFEDVDVPEDVEGAFIAEEGEVVIGGERGEGFGERGFGAGFIPPVMDDGDAGSAVEEFVGFGMGDEGGGVAGEEEVDFVRADVLEGFVPEEIEVVATEGVGVEVVEGMVEEEVAAAIQDGVGEEFGPPDMGGDHDGAGGRWAAGRGGKVLSFVGFALGLELSKGEHEEEYSGGGEGGGAAWIEGARRLYLVGGYGKRCLWRFISSCGSWKSRFGRAMGI